MSKKIGLQRLVRRFGSIPQSELVLVWGNADRCVLKIRWRTKANNYEENFYVSRTELLDLVLTECVRAEDLETLDDKQFFNRLAGKYKKN